jgi:hypothetical protein
MVRRYAARLAERAEVIAGVLADTSAAQSVKEKGLSSR